MVLKRPIGRKAEKAKRKRKDGNNEFREYLAKKLHYIQESHEQDKEALYIKAERVRVDAQRADMEKERLRLETIKEDERIMRSSEEEDEFQRSVKKFKENNGKRSFLPPRKLVSYKDSLVGDILGAYEQAFKFGKDWEEDYESENEMEPLTEGMAEVKLSKETKARIRAPWSRALIVKAYGRSVGFHYLTFKINALWKPTAKMDCVTLVHSDSADSNSETARVVAGLNTQNTLEMRKDCEMEDCLENPSAGCQLDPRHISGNKRKAIAKNKGKGNEGLGIRNSKNSKSHKRLPNCTEGRSGRLLLSKELGSDNQVENREIFDRANTTAKIRMGNLVQELSGGYTRGDNSSDKSGANGNTGMVRGRTETGVEASVSHCTRKYQFGGPSIGAQGMGSHTQPVVELPHGCAGDLMRSIRGAEQAKEAIRDAPLGRI
nr:hypothetical protein CFP56_65577 [Quercus suber]